MWAKVAEELQVPWRAAEAMHWQLGESDMARRAGVVPFSLASGNVESASRAAAPRPGTHFQPQDNVSRHLTPPSPRTMYARNPPMSVVPVGPPARVEPLSHAPGLPPGPPPGPPGPPGPGFLAPLPPDHGELYYTAGPGLAPIQTQGQPRNPGPLPSLAELTTGVSPYGTPVERPRSGPRGPAPKHGTMLPAVAQSYPGQDTTRPKRRASPETMQRENSHRRRIG